MIRLTRLNDDDFALNADLIRYVEERPDTIITLTTGERVTVRQDMDEVIRRAVEYQRSKHLLPAPGATAQGPSSRVAAMSTHNDEIQT